MWVTTGVTTQQHPDASSTNGIYDTPYSISVGGENNDSYPLVSRFEYYYILNLTDVPSTVTGGKKFTVTVKSEGGNNGPWCNSQHTWSIQ